MSDFVLRELCTDNVLPELRKIGFDSSYAPRVIDKFLYKNIKIYGLSAPQANILKQLALSVGADCATPKDTITGMIESADCILGGSISQLQKIAVKLGVQPFNLRKLGRQIEDYIKISSRENSRTQVMGILNITENSFSDGGLYSNYDDAIKHLNQLVEDGADIIDIGAESTKPYSNPVESDEQIKKILPILNYINKSGIEIPISIDTRSAEVAKACLDSGATAINDVSGLSYDKNMVQVIANYNCPIVIQHTKGSPEIMQDNPVYESLMDDIYNDLSNKISYALLNGVNIENIIVDPGIGFGKTREHNFEILRRIGEFKGLNCPILLGLSRKSLLDMPEADNQIKDVYTLALNAIAIENKVDIIRVHNVALHRKLINMLSV